MEQVKTKQHIRLRQILKEKEFWFLVVIGILFFYRPLFLGETFFYRDLYVHFIPQRQLLADIVNAGDMPLWDPNLHGGQPYLGQISNSAYYPSTFLYLFFPLFRALNLDIVLHFLGYLLFAYTVARVLDLSSLSSFIVGISYGFCGYTLSIINILNLFWAMMYIPLLVLFWHLFLLERRTRWFLLSVLVGVIQVFASSPEVSSLSFLFLLGWTLFYPYPHRSLLRRFLLWVLLGIFTIGIASIHIIPTLEILSISSRKQGLNYAAFVAWSMSLKRFPELLLPGFLGDAGLLPRETYYWGINLVDEESPYIISIYVGGVLITLAAIGGLRKGCCCHTDPLPFRIRRFLLFTCGFILILSLGHRLPFFHALYQYVPVIRIFRYPIKFLLIALLPIALLAGYTADVHFNRLRSKDPQSQELAPPDWSPSTMFLTLLWSILGMFAIIILTFFFSDTFARHFQIFFFGRLGGEIARRGLTASFAHASAIWLMMTLLYHYRHLKRTSWQQWLLAGILLVDLLSAGRNVNFYAPEELLTLETPVLQVVRNEIGEGRLFRDEVPGKKVLNIPSENIFQIPSEHIVWGTRWNLEVLSLYLGVYYNIPMIFHRDISQLAQAQVARLTTLLESLPWEKRLPLLSASGVTVVITLDQIDLPGLTHITDISNWSEHSFSLYRNDMVAKRVEFITTWIQADSDEEAVRLMLQPEYDPRKHVVLQLPGPSLFGDSPPAKHLPTAAQPASECDGGFHITKRESTNHSSKFSVSNECEGYLVFAEPFYPGWRTYVDGELTPIFRANFAFSAIFLPPGEHDVIRSYRPNLLLVGTLFSLLFCGGLWFTTSQSWFIKGKENLKEDG